VIVCVCVCVIVCVCACVCVCVIVCVCACEHIEHIEHIENTQTDPHTHSEKIPFIWNNKRLFYPHAYTPRNTAQTTTMRCMQAQY